MKNLSTVTILAICMLISFSLASAQTVPAIEWQNTIGGDNYDELYSVIQTTDGGYLLGGKSGSGISGDKTEASQGSTDYWVVKVDGSGNILWQNTIGGNDYDYLFSVIQTTDGGYLLGGNSVSGISGDKTEANQGWEDYWIVKLDGTGNILWQNTIGGSNPDILYSVIQTTDGGYLLGGISSSPISGDKTEASQGYDDYWVVKLDASGNLLWQNTIGGTNYDYLYSAIQTTEGGYLVGGHSSSPISGDITEACQGGTDYWVVKLNGSGDILWQNTIGGNDYDYLRSVIQTTEGNYLLGGYSYSDISGDKTEASLYYDYWVVKLDGSGNILWQNTIGGNDDDNLRSVIQTTDGGYLLGGWSDSGISGDKTEASEGFNDYWVVKLDESGNILWQNTIGGNYTDYLYSVIQTTDFGYLLGGTSWSGITGDKTEESQGVYDYWVVKLSAEGAIECHLPTSLSASNITPTSVNLEWDAVPGDVGYKLRYKIAGTPEWTNIQSIDNDKTLHGLAESTEYAWQVKSICSTQPIVSSDWSEKQFFITDALRLSALSETKIEVYPNPVSQSATVSFSLNKASHVVMEIMDVNGRSLRVIADENFSEGNHAVTFFRESLKAGIYFLQMKTDEGLVVIKILIE